MKRLTRAEQGRTWSMIGLRETKVGRLAESRLEQEEDYGRIRVRCPLGRAESLPWGSYPGSSGRRGGNSYFASRDTSEVPFFFSILKMWSAIDSSSLSCDTNMTCFESSSSRRLLIL